MPSAVLAAAQAGAAGVPQALRQIPPSADDPEVLAAEPCGRVWHYGDKAGTIIPAVPLAGLISDVPGN